MMKSLTICQQWLSSDLRRPAVLISLIFSIWVILTNDTINTDGILYLDVAYHIGNWDWANAAKIYHWNFYPALIALVSKITFLGLETSALVINSLFFAGIAWIFLSLLQTLGADRPVLIAGLIIISIHPYINDYRADVLRGPGFWFCILWALSLLIKTKETGKYWYGILLACAFIIATLFRIEGIAFLLFAPFVLLFRDDQPFSQRIKLFASTYLVPAICGLFLLLVWLIIGDSFSTGRLTYPAELLGKAYQALANKIPEKGEILAAQVLNPKSDDYGIAGVIAVLTTILLLTTIKRITLFYLILAIYAQLKIKVKHMPVLLWLSTINLTYMAIYLTHYFFLSSRFAMPLALYAALPASFALAVLLRKKDNSATPIKLLKILGIVIMVFMLLDGLVSTGSSKSYIRDAGHWLKENIKPGETLLTNQFAINHYADIRMTRESRRQIIDFNYQLSDNHVKDDDIKSADYIAIRVKHADTASLDRISNIMGRQPIKEFSVSKKEKVIIYYSH